MPTGSDWLTPPPWQTDDPEIEYLYTGERLDPENGGYDYGFRDYAPRLARFTAYQAHTGWVCGAVALE